MSSPLERQLNIEKIVRTAVAPAESRSLIVQAENRGVTPPPTDK